MTLQKRLRLGVSTLACIAAVSTGAVAETPRPLSPTDAQHYAAAFQAVDQGDFIDAEMQATEIQDKSLLGYLSFRQLMHPTAHKASFEELSSWLARFRDLPLAQKVFNLAARRQPADVARLPTPAVALADDAPQAGVRGSPDRGRPAREAFYAGDAKRALTLAAASGENWIAGLSAYRLNDYPRAQDFFRQVADNAGNDAWLRSAGAYWAARSALAAGDAVTANSLLRLAAQSPQTFYGMIAERQVGLAVAPNPDAGRMTLAAYTGSTLELMRFMNASPRAHRAAALAQIGRLDDARQEMKAGLTLAASPEERQGWSSLVLSLGGMASVGAALSLPVRALDTADYPAPMLAPKSGFTIDKALVYAIVRQESRFNPLAVSPVGATGLMQLMPEAAARAAGDDKLKADMTPLFDPAFNLRVGQDYVTWLMERGVGYDILRTVAAYNGGPGTLLKTANMLGDGADSLLVIECLPSQETRNYVEKVMAGYWTYRRMWGQDVRTLDAIASGAKTIDARLDLADAAGAATQAASQPLQIGMR